MTLGRDLAFVARDADMASRVLGRELGLRCSNLDDGFGHRMPVFSVGDSALALFSPGHPGVAGETKPGVHHIALGVDHLESGLEEASKASIQATGKSETGARRTAADRVGARGDRERQDVDH